MLKQKTLKDSFSLSGKGLHTGLDLTVTFNPAPDNHGYKIQRTDLEGQPIIDAVADNVTETTRGTVLSKNGVKISTVEHGMAAPLRVGHRQLPHSGERSGISYLGWKCPILCQRNRTCRYSRTKCRKGFLYYQIQD